MDAARVVRAASFSLNPEFTTPHSPNKLMKTKLLLTLTVLLALADVTRAQGNAFTYQGRLNDGGGAANGSYDLRFAIYDALANGNAIGSAVTNAATAVTSGLFTVTLDFGAGVFTGPPRWLELAVRTNGGASFTTLAQRQPLTPSPYALYAASASSATTAATFAGPVADKQLSANIPRLNGNATFSGSVAAAAFTGNGAPVTNANTATLNGEPDASKLNDGFWSSVSAIRAFRNQKWLIGCAQDGRHQARDREPDA